MYNTYAVVALMLGVASFLDGYIIGGLLRLNIPQSVIQIVLYALPTAALILAILALRQINRTGEGGKVMAIIAIVISAYKVLGVLFLLWLSATLV